MLHRVLRCSGALCLAALLLTRAEPATAAVALVHINLSVDVAEPGTAIDAEIVVETERPLGAYTFTLDCDEAALEIIPPLRGGDTEEFASPPIQNVTGACSAVLSAFQAASLVTPSGTVSVAHVDLRVRDDATLGTEQLLDLSVAELSDTDGVEIVNQAEDAVVSIPGSPVICGDADGDGNVTAADALATLRAAVGGEACDPSACDVDANESITAGDALRILTAIVGIPISLTCP